MVLRKFCGRCVKVEEAEFRTDINFVSGLIVLLVTILINFFLSPYIVNKLGEEANGFVQLANNFIMFTSLITLSMNSMGGRFISFHYHKDKYEEVNHLYSSLFIGNIIIIGILIIPVVAFVANMEDIISISKVSTEDTQLLFLFAFINFFIMQFVEIFNISAYVMNRIYITNMLSAASKILNVLLLCSLFGFFKVKMYYVSLASLVASTILLCSSYTVRKRIFSRAKISWKYFDFHVIIRLLRSGIWNTINQCGNILMMGLDLLLTNLFIGASEMGVLSVAKIVPNVITQMVSTINNTFAPSLTIAYASGNKEALVKQIKSSIKLSTLLVSTCIMLLCVFGESFYRLWIPALDASRLNVLSVITCMAFIPLAGPTVLYNVFTTMNRLAGNSITFTIGGIINCILVYLLIKNTNLGIFAVAGVSSCVQICRNLCFVIPYAAKILELKWYTFYKDVFISILCGASCFLIGSIVKWCIDPYTWMSLCVSVSTAGILMLIINGSIFLTRYEKKAILCKIRMRINK